MTCIAGIVDSLGNIHIAADSAGYAEGSVTIRIDEKVFIRNEFIFGITSSFRMGQLLRFSLKPPKHPKGMSRVSYNALHRVRTKVL